jgi:hypothetical protein
MSPNFILLDTTLPDVARLVAAMVQARDGVESRSWSHPQEPITEDWWADVLADPRARIRKRRSNEIAIERTLYRLADEPRATILVACSKCEWKAAYQRHTGPPVRCRACLTTSPHRAVRGSVPTWVVAACTTSSRSRAAKRHPYTASIAFLARL